MTAGTQSLLQLFRWSLQAELWGSNTSRLEALGNLAGEAAWTQAEDSPTGELWYVCMKATMLQAVLSSQSSCEFHYHCLNISLNKICWCIIIDCTLVTFHFMISQIYSVFSTVSLTQRNRMKFQDSEQRQLSLAIDTSGQLIYCIHKKHHHNQRCKITARSCTPSLQMSPSVCF